MRDNAIDVESSWKLIHEFNRQTFDRIPNFKPVFIGNEKECGEIQAYDNQFDKSNSKKPMSISPFNGSTFETSLFDDPIMVKLIEQNKADIFTTDVIAAAIMCGTKSNYSYDIEIQRFENKIFIDKRQNP